MLFPLVFGGKFHIVVIPELEACVIILGSDKLMAFELEFGTFGEPLLGDTVTVLERMLVVQLSDGGEAEYAYFVGLVVTALPYVTVQPFEDS